MNYLCYFYSVRVQMLYLLNARVTCYIHLPHTFAQEHAVYFVQIDLAYSSVDFIYLHTAYFLYCVSMFSFMLLWCLHCSHHTVRLHYTGNIQPRSNIKCYFYALYMCVCVSVHGGNEKHSSAVFSQTSWICCKIRLALSSMLYIADFSCPAWLGWLAPSCQPRHCRINSLLLQVWKTKHVWNPFSNPDLHFSWL